MSLGQFSYSQTSLFIFDLCSFVQNVIFTAPVAFYAADFNLQLDGMGFK